MGNLCQTSRKSTNSNKPMKDESGNLPCVEEINRNSFNFTQVISVTSVSKSWKAIYKKTNTIFEIKELKKRKIAEKKLNSRVINERDISSKLHYPFLPTLEYSFQDYENLYLVSEYFPCGNLKFHISKYKKLSEQELKFVVICVVLGLEYLHANKIVHLDIRPENLVLDDKGYFRINNFLYSCIISDKNNEKIDENIFNENLLYLAPEIFQGMPYSYYSDYYSLGITCYEIMIGRKAYIGNYFKQVKEQIMVKQYEIKEEEIPKGWSAECADFINKLIIRKPYDRLGNLEINEIKSHAWFKMVNWMDYYKKKIKSPFGNVSIDDAYSTILYSPVKKGFVGNTTKILSKTISLFTDFIYYDKKSPNNLKIKTVGFYNPQTKLRFKPESLITKLNEINETNDVTGRSTNLSNKSSLGKRNSSKDIESFKYSLSREMNRVNSNKSNYISGTTIFNDTIVKDPEIRQKSNL